MLALLTVLLLVAAARAWRLHARIALHECLHVADEGLMRHELWRRASLQAHVDASGARTFPLPQESRVRLWRFAGLPIHCEVQSLGLPAQVTERIGSVDAAQFDALFSAPFRRRAATGGPAAATGS